MTSERQMLLLCTNHLLICFCDFYLCSSFDIYFQELVLTLVIYIGCGVLLLAALIAMIRHFYIYRSVFFIEYFKIAAFKRAL